MIFAVVQSEGTGTAPVPGTEWIIATAEIIVATGIAARAVSG
jgi:hypothetical protein